MRKTILFTECEHNGDLQNYIEDLELAGAKIIQEIPDFDAEEARVIIEVENIENFKIAYMVTDSYDFATIF